MGLLIKTKVKESKIQGEGLFTLEYIKKGQIIFEDSDLIRIKESTYKQLKIKKLNDWIDKYCTIKDNSYRNSHLLYEKTYFVDRDNMIYINHSINPNIEFIDNIAVALSDINEGEELTCNYTDITTEDHFKFLLNGY